MQDRILLFIPMYNCEKQIVRVLDQLNGEITQYISEVILVNNRSTDNGEAAVQNYFNKYTGPLPMRLLRNHQNYGLGGSHKVAFDYAIKNQFDYVIVLHGDDQGSIFDFLQLIENGTYKKYDCCLGSRFMRGSRADGYSTLRKVGNYGFNILFSIITRKRITDLGSGLNLYKVSSLEDRYYFKFPDTLYFNDCMILAQCYYKQKILFVPISWREEDQVSNNKLVQFSISLLQLCARYISGPKKFVESEMREKAISEYSYSIVQSNFN